MAGGGYNAGSIYVDFEVRNKNAISELDKLEKKLEALTRKEKDLVLQKKAAQQAYDTAVAKYGANSSAAQKLAIQLERLSLKEQNLKKDLDNVRSGIQNQSNIISQNASAINRYNSLLGNLDLGFKNVTGAVGAFKAAILALGAKKLYDALIIPNAELESNLASMEVLLNSYEKASTLVSRLTEMAAKTPLTSPDLIASSKQLLAVGVQYEDLMGIISMLGDLSMGSAEKLQSLVHAFGKITSSGKATIEYLNLFTENGIPVINALSDVLGVSTEEFFKLSRAGQVTANDVVSALKLMTSEGGQFYGMLEKQSKTFSGVMSTLKDNLMMFGRDIGTEAFEELKGYIEDLVTELDKMRESGELEVMAVEWGGAIAELVKWLGDAVKILIEYKEVVGVVLGIMAGYSVFTKMGRAIATLGTAGTAAVGVIGLLGSGVALFAGELNKISAQTKVLNKEFLELAESNDTMIETYEKGTKGIDEQTKKAQSLIDTIDSLNSKENASRQEKENLVNAIRELNDLYPELNLQYDEEHNKLTQNTQDLRDYVDAFKLKTKASMFQDIGTSIQTQIEETTIAMRKLVDENKSIEEELNKPLTLKQSVATAITDPFKGIALADKMKSNTELIKQYQTDIDSLINSLVEYSLKSNEWAEEEAKANQIIEEKTEALKTQEEVTKEIITASQQNFDAASEGYKNLSDSIDSTISDLQTFADILEQEGNSLSLTRSQVVSLLKTYPELVSKISDTADGYSIERDVVKSLMDTKKEEQETAINSEVEKTRQTLLSTQERLSAYATEIAQISSLAEAQATLSNLQGFQSLLDESIGGQTFGWVDTLEDTRKASTEEIDQWKKDLTSAISGLNEAVIPGWEKFEELNKEAQARIKSLSVSAGKSGKTSGSKSGESTEEKMLRDLKFLRDMEVITEKQYYDELEIIKNKYYKNGTKQWQQYTLEIVKGRKKMNEDLKKAEQQEFEDRLKNSYEWIETQDFYDKLSNEEKIAGYERMKTYTKEFYSSGKIDYKRYVESIKKLDKEIYTVQKDNLKTSNDELSDLRKKRYDEAVKQVEDYYDNLSRAEEEAERKKQLSELETQLELYQGAVTRAGQEKYKEIEESIEDIKKEGEKAAREVEKESKLEELESTYKSLEETQNAYFDSVLTYSEDVTKKIQEMTNLVNTAFANVGNILSGINNSTTNNNSSYSTTVNQTNHISNPESGRAVVKMTDILYRYPVK